MARQQRLPIPFEPRHADQHFAFMLGEYRDRLYEEGRWIELETREIWHLLAWAHAVQTRLVPPPEQSRWRRKVLRCLVHEAASKALADTLTCSVLGMELREEAASLLLSGGPTAGLHVEATYPGTERAIRARPLKMRRKVAA